MKKESWKVILYILHFCRQDTSKHIKIFDNCYIRLLRICIKITVALARSFLSPFFAGKFWGWYQRSFRLKGAILKIKIEPCFTKNYFSTKVQCYFGYKQKLFKVRHLCRMLFLCVRRGKNAAICSYLSAYLGHRSKGIKQYRPWWGHRDNES